MPTLRTHHLQQQLSRKEIEELLKKGAYGAIMDENAEESKFNEEDIETILLRRTTTITLEVSVSLFVSYFWNIFISLHLITRQSDKSSKFLILHRFFKNVTTYRLSSFKFLFRPA